MDTENFEFKSLPRQVYFGKGKIEKLTELLTDYQKAFVVVEEKQEEQINQLEASVGTDKVVRFMEVSQHVPQDLVLKARQSLEENEADVLVAIGGGSAIGLVKALALDNGLPIIAVPTSFAGSEMTDIWGISDQGKKTTGRDLKVLPGHVIYDSDITISLPPKFAAMSAMNAMAHLMEAAYAVDINPVTYTEVIYGIKQMMIGMHVMAKEKRLTNSSNNLFLMGAFIGGKALSEVSMSIHHKAAHVLGGSFGLHHAKVHTVMQAYVLELLWPSLVNKVKEDIKKSMMHPYPPAALKEAAMAMDLPHTLREIGFREEDIERAADIMMEKPYEAPTEVTKDMLVKLLTNAYNGKFTANH